MLLDLINIQKLRRAIVYGGLLLLVFFVQNVLVARIAIFGVYPFILPLAVVAVSFFEGSIWGGVFGLFLGLFADMYMNGPAVLLTVAFPAIGFLSGALANFLVNRRFFSYFFVGLAGLLVTALCQMIPIIAVGGSRLWPLLAITGLQTLWSLPFAFLLYGPCRRLSGADFGK